MTQVQIELELENVMVVKSRIQDYDDRADHVISRAFSSLKEFAHIGLRLLKKDGSLLAMKGPGYEIELAVLRLPFTRVHRVSVPILNAERFLIEVAAN